MEFKQLQSFTAVVKYNSFTIAAEKLFISQPTISAHIRQLEDELNIRLISRTTKNIEITPKTIPIGTVMIRRKLVKHPPVCFVLPSLLLPSCISFSI